MTLARQCGFAARLVAICLAVPALAQTPAPSQDIPPASPECARDWQRADVNGDGVLTSGELERIEKLMVKIDTDRDSRVTAKEFISACEKGFLKDVTF